MYAKLKVEHGCAVATIGASRGVVVVGGATGDDVVEFLDWDTREKWVTKGKLNRGRGKWNTLIKHLLLSNPIIPFTVDFSFKFCSISI